MDEVISEETRKRIEEGLRTWHEPNSEARKRFEAAKKELDKQHRPYQELLERSTRLTAKDMMFTINTRA